MSKIICLGIIIVCAFGFAQERGVANPQLSRLEAKIAQLENQITELKKLLQTNESTKKSADFTPESRLWLEGTMGWTQTGDSLYPNTATANVGIGTSNPTQRLDVDGAIKVGANVESADSTGAIRWDGSHFEGYNGTAWVALDIDSTAGDNDWVISGNNMYSAVPGSVGVGVTSPTEKLDVNGAVNVSSVYKIGGDRVLSNPGTDNIFVGVGAGENTIGEIGHGNTFSGWHAGYSNTTGTYNTFSGYEAGLSNTTGRWNTFLGLYAGDHNTTGNFNTFSGGQAGDHNTTGSYNAFLGCVAGYYNTTGSYNTFSGVEAGCWNAGSYNTFSGNAAGYKNTAGACNVFIGYRAGYYNTTDSNRLYIANDSSDANVLIYGEFDTRRVGIGTTSPTEALDVNGDCKADTFFGDGSQLTGIPGDNDWTISGNNMYSAVSGNVGIGTTSPMAKLVVAGNVQIEENLNVSRGIYAANLKIRDFGGAQNLAIAVGPVTPDGDLSGFYSTYAGDGERYNILKVGVEHLNGPYTPLEIHYNKIIANGSVGIGTASPGSKLDVNGAVNVSSVYKIGGDRVLSNAGTDNIFVGVGAGENNTTGQGNTFSGNDAGYLNAEGDSNVFIGYLAGYNETGSNKLYIANGQNDVNVLIYGEFDNRRVGIGTVSPTANLDVNGSTGYNQVRMRTSFTPTATGDANGNIGDIAWDDNHIYIKTNAGWKRAALSTW